MHTDCVACYAKNKIRTCLLDSEMHNVNPTIVRLIVNTESQS